MRWWRPSVTLLGTVLLFGTPFEGQVIPLTRSDPPEAREGPLAMEGQ